MGNKDNVNNLDEQEQNFKDEKLDNKEDRKDIPMAEEKEKEDESKDDVQHMKTENADDLNSS